MSLYAAQSACLPYAVPASHDRPALPAGTALRIVSSVLRRQGGKRVTHYTLTDGTHTWHAQNVRHLVTL